MPTQAVITQRATHIRSNVAFEARLSLSMQSSSGEGMDSGLLLCMQGNTDGLAAAYETGPRENRRSSRRFT
jgi:hypothetical protein